MEALRRLYATDNGLFHRSGCQNPHCVRVRLDRAMAHGKQAVPVKGGVGGTDAAGNSILGHSRQLGGLGLIHRRVGDHTANDRVFSHQLAAEHIPLERIDGGAFRFVAPGSALNEVEKICEDSDNLMTIIQGKRHLMFETGSTQLICRRLEGEFLDYRNAIPRNNPISILVDTKAMLNSLDRVSVVISEKLKSPVHCIFDADRVYLSAKTGNGEAKDICPVEGDGQGLEIGFNNRFFMDALRYAPAEKVKMELNTGISPCIMTPVEGEENFLYMVLPVRLKA